MPSINDASAAVTFPNKFSAPFANDPPTPLYASIPISGPSGDCLACVVCGKVKDRVFATSQDTRTSVVLTFSKS